MRTYGSGRHALLPDWHAVLNAFASRRHPDDHPICQWADTLMRLHRAASAEHGRTEVIVRRRDDLIAVIDGWVESHVLAGQRLAELRLPSLGRAVDEMARARNRAEQLLAAATPSSAVELHEAWSTIGLLANRWSDLVACVDNGQRLALNEWLAGGTPVAGSGWPAMDSGPAPSRSSDVCARSPACGST